MNFSYVKTMRQFFFFFLARGKRKGNLSTKQKHKGSHKEVKFTRLKKVRNKLLFACELTLQLLLRFDKEGNNFYYFTEINT